MVDVVVEQQATSGGTVGGAFNILGQIWQIFITMLPYLIVITIIVVLGIIIYYLFLKREEEQREKDEPAYYMYKQTIRNCNTNKNDKYIKKTWRLINLLWFGIPLAKKECSMQIRDMDNHLIGYYRGESYEMDNSWNLMLYKEKFFFFWETTFILKIPLHIHTKSVEINEQGIKIEKKYQINLMRRVKRLPNGNIKIYCSSIQKVSMYYYCPVFIVDNDRGFLDYRKALEGTIVDNTYQVMVTRLLNTGSQQMEKSMMFNPYLQYAQKAPQKTKEEKKLDGDVPDA